MNFNRDAAAPPPRRASTSGTSASGSPGGVDWRVPRSVLREMEAAEELTRDNTGMTLTIAFNYGGRTEIVDAVKRILRDHDAGRLRSEKITRRLDPSNGCTTPTCPIPTC